MLKPNKLGLSSFFVNIIIIDTGTVFLVKPLAGLKRFALQLHMAVVGIFWELVRKFWSEPADESRHQNGSTVRSKGVKQMSAMLKSEQILPEGGLLLLDEARDLLSEGQVPGAFKRLV